MDVKSRNESYTKWKSGQVSVMVATLASGLGINKPDTKHIVRYGVPENICSWAQELGRGGWSGEPATATIYFTHSDSDHATAWVHSKVWKQEHCLQILEEFSSSWRYVLSWGLPPQNAP